MYFLKSYCWYFHGPTFSCGYRVVIYSLITWLLSNPALKWSERFKRCWLPSSLLSYSRILLLMFPDSLHCWFIPLLAYNLRRSNPSWWDGYGARSVRQLVTLYLQLRTISDWHEMGPGYKPSRSITSEPLPLVRPYFFKFLEPFQTALPSRSQVFKHRSVWGVLHIQTTR